MSYGTRFLRASAYAAMAACAWLCLAASPTRANPRTSQIFRVRQCEGSNDVQITLGLDPSFLSEPAPRLWYVERDGHRVRDAWSEPTEFRADSGSGVKRFTAWQLCDCDVAPGRHVWFTLAYRQELSLVVSAQGAGPTSSGPIDGSQLSWRNSDPVEAQGIDCKARCAARRRTPSVPSMRAAQPRGCSADRATHDTAPDLRVFAIVAAALWSRWRARRV